MGWVMSCTVLRRTVTAIALFLALAACGPRSQSADSAQSGANDASSEQSSPSGLVWRSFVARDFDAAGVPRNAHVFAPGPVSYYLMASGASNDTIQAGLVADGATIQECDADVLDGDDGYFCTFDYVAPGEYEVWALLNGEPLEARAFEIIGPPDPSIGFSASDEFAPSAAPRLSAIPWRERPSERDYQRAYPRRALDRGISGRVLLRCTILERGDVTCVIVEETPADAGFGAAALRLSRRFRMHTEFEGGQSTVGATIEVPVEFKTQ
jgi:TonB family protein